MRLIEDASCRALSGDFEANLLQLPVVVVSFGAIALLKRRCFESPLSRRHRTVWRYDAMRQLMSSVCGMVVLIVFARGLEGNDCLNFIGLVSCDLVVGTAVDGMLLWLFAAGGRVRAHERGGAFHQLLHRLARADSRVPQSLH